MSTPFSTEAQNLPFPHEKGKSLKEFSTFKIGGPAKFFAIAKNRDDFKKMISFCYQASLPFLVLGKGSNTLFDDRGFNGLVILNKLDYLKVSDNRFVVGSGYSFARLGVQSAGKGFSGLEFAAGIPATVGGAVFMNAGANGQETKDFLESVSYLNASGEELIYKKSDLDFSYRTSSFQKMKGAILEAVFLLKPFTDAKKTQKQALEYRLSTQPYKEPSIGCIFRNPSEKDKAAFLIDKSGLKGISEGGVTVSKKHANFIVNTENGSAHDVLNLIEKIKETVLKETGICLHEEIRFIPYEF